MLTKIAYFDETGANWIMEELNKNNIFNEKASQERYGLVIYPKK